MTDKVKALYENLKKREYRKNRVHAKPVKSDPIENQVEFFREVASFENPVLFENDSFGFNRYTDFIAPSRFGNITPNYKRIITDGFDKAISDIENNIRKTDDPKKQEYGKTMLGLLEICLCLAEKYREHAKEKGNTKLYNALTKIPHKGAKSFYEALLFMKFCTYVLRLYGATHITLGRFDQYMYSFYLDDKNSGVSKEDLFEMLEEFFISINYDTDLYPGVQQGDNGQSMVLGGFDKDGNSMYNELSQMCMEASLDLAVIDPKINLRVGKNTPDELYEFGTLLTKQGLGFPQYCNDDVVVPGLVKLGYDKEDALNYTVAACWEYIIPDVGADVPNITVMNFPKVVNEIVVKNLCNCESFDTLMDYVSRGIALECDRLIEENNKTVLYEEPLLSVFVDGCIESLTDMWKKGGKYLNFGCHGAGIANATDALAAIKKNVFDEKNVGKKELLDALEADFEGYSELRNLLKNSPKMGNNDSYADDIASLIMNAFSENMNKRKNGHGGIWRAGTGSAMAYLWGESCPATADGRKKGEPYSSSFSPSLDVKSTGLLSVIQSFSSHDMTEIINGGPLTIEIHDTVLKNDIGIKKTAMLVKNFILLGGHQLQLNAINRDRLLDAQRHPENYPNLIVRVWGWSGYFNELDVRYQNHIIRRCEFTD